MTSEQVNDDNKVIVSSNTKSIKLPWIQLGKYEFETLCKSSCCKELLQADKIYICEFCLKWSLSFTCWRRHRSKCTQDRPPGRLIYSQSDVNVYEVEGWKYQTYCEDLCLMATFFIDSKKLLKGLCFLIKLLFVLGKVETKNVHRFIFYVLTVKENDGYHFSSYFSKIHLQERLNLSCLLVLPPYRRRGFGSLLISISYGLSKLVKHYSGTPERPLSSQGLLCYRKFWKAKIFQYLLSKTNSNDIVINDISQETSIATNDIIETLASLNMIKMLEKDRLIIIRPQDLFDEYINQIANSSLMQIQYDQKYLRLKQPSTSYPLSVSNRQTLITDDSTLSFLMYTTSDKDSS
ncbi:unnamed protein product [Didymodactylos carnosus]|uniref:histone acetyltransferase n=1 Tax=Didymodactylos carnosus TaxID=1234261 RepID=A0A813P6C6_9BILA|nr:unnamed protein product [Didymodactylos carnosus]CAF0748237.1 unnamed protein product [Didymodactylos carnosus]CAF3506851.1 unnamed protein product [Didymodactylos carnosus]CAF3527358.1 unnamed protein product [Didymodactylos carnosus]